jgi:hypothetical protein
MALPDVLIAVPAGAGGWGAKGKLDLEKIRASAQGA